MSKLQNLAEAVRELHESVERTRTAFGRAIQVAQHVPGAEKIEILSARELAEDRQAMAVQEMIDIVRALGER